MNILFRVKKIISKVLILVILFLIFPTQLFAGPKSSNYELKQYNFGSGGVDNAKSPSYSLNGVAGEINAGNTKSVNYSIGQGLNYIYQADTPVAPTLTNPSSYYDRLKMVVNPGSNASDSTFAIEISTDKFVTDIRYIKSDGSVGSTLASTDFKTYSNWQGASGTIVTGLINNTAYFVRAKAKQGTFTETQWGPMTADPGVSTVNPTLTFALSSSNVAFSNLNAGNSYTDTTPTTTLTTTTNALNGYTVYAKETDSLRLDASNTIPDYGSPNSSPTTWSGNGFGYSTSETSLIGSGGLNRFNNHTNYAGFPISSSSVGDPVADSTTSVTTDAKTIYYRVTTSSTQAAGTYSNVIQYTIVPLY